MVKGTSTPTPLKQHPASGHPSGFPLFSSENRILMMAILFISLAFLLLAGFIYSRYKATLDETYQNFGTLIASTVSVGGVERLQSPYSSELKVKNFVDNMLLVSEDIAAIEFYDSTGQLIYESHRAMPNEALKKTIDFSSPLTVMRDGEVVETLGEVHVKLTGKTMSDILSASRMIVLIVFVGAWVLAILAVLFHTYIMSKHLKTLVQGVKRLSTGDFGYKIQGNDLWGELRHLAESFNDMSVRLRAYEDQNVDTIAFERNKLKAILLSIADGVVVCDNQGDMILLNESACQMLGVKSSDVLLGTNIRRYITVEGEHCFRPIVDEFEELCQEYDHTLPEHFIRHVEMPEITLKVITSPIHDADGDRLGFVMIMHDVTKETAVDKLKTNFISNVSHELRTPVTTIKSYVDTVYNHGKELDPETYNEFIETINVETDRLKKLVNDILDFSRLEEGGMPVEMEYQDITPIINLTVQSVKVLAQQKNLTLTTAIESNLPKAYINSDCIERVMRNLLSNAIKYTPDGGRIRVRAEIAEGEEALEISVQDTGIGIAEEHLPHIFDRFYRVENAVHTIKGTGLGLHLVKTYVEKYHRGTITVKSEPEQGSTFTVRLPLTPPHEEEIVRKEVNAGLNR